MLPIVGLVAVGMLVLGIRMFFFPSPKGEITPQGVEDAQAISPTGGQPDKPGDKTSAGGGGEVMAVPEGSAPAAEAPAPKPKDAQPKPEVKTAAPKTKLPATVAAGGTSPAAKPATVQAKPAVDANAKEAWNVQVGAFKDRSNAENLVKKLKQEGFPARLVEVKAGGSILSKVLVQAGPERASAETLAKTLGEKGYPVLVVQRP
jgi:cell division septation protein DedD